MAIQYQPPQFKNMPSALAYLKSQIERILAEATMIQEQLNDFTMSITTVEILDRFGDQIGSLMIQEDNLKGLLDAITARVAQLKSRFSDDRQKLILNWEAEYGSLETGFKKIHPNLTGIMGQTRHYGYKDGWIRNEFDAKNQAIKKKALAILGFQIIQS